MAAVIDVTERPVIGLGIDNTPKTAYPDGIASAAVLGVASTTAVAAASGVAGATTEGSPSLTASVAPDGIAGAEGFGTAQANAAITHDGIASGAVIGTPEGFTSMNPDGVAAGGGIGTPALTASMSPGGLESAVVFGDADTLATVFIVPGPVDPSNDFGNATVTRKGWVFRTPRNTYQWRIPPYKEYEGISVLKESGTWVEVAHPDIERTRNATYYLAGGRDHVLSTDLKDELVAEGYTVTEEVVTTEVFL